MRSTVCAQKKSADVHSPTHMIFHFGELMLKGRNRGDFESQLIRNVRKQFASTGICSLRKQPGRLILEFDNTASWDVLRHKAARVFGAANALVVYVCEASFDDLSVLVESVVRGKNFRTFAVRCKRAEKQFPLRSDEICIRIGSLVEQISGARVDLENPECTIWITVLSHQIFVGLDKIQGARGLPVGVSGRVACLLSGGIDSPVAVWRMMGRGCVPVCMHFHSAPFTQAASQEKVRELCRVLAQWHAPIRLAMVPFGEIQQDIVAKTNEALRVLLYRRFMMRIASALAGTERAVALVTGESLAQVASQTLSNMATVEAASALPVLRPLVGLDKEEIIRDARRIGTYDLSIEPHHDCCTYLEPQRPATGSTPEVLQRAEAVLDVEALVSSGVAGAAWENVVE